VRDNGEPKLVLLHLEISVARLTDGQRDLRGGTLTSGGGSSFRRDGEGFRLGNGDRRAQNGIQIASSRREHLVGYLCRNGGVGGRGRGIDGAGFDAEFRLGLSSSEELLVDSDVIAVKFDVRAGAIGITFEDDVDIRRNAEEHAELKPNASISQQEQ
jgi:hypothetical protein